MLRCINLSNNITLGCGYIVWALGHINDTSCHHCGATVKTKSMTKLEESFAFGGKAHKNELKFVRK